MSAIEIPNFIIAAARVRPSADGQPVDFVWSRGIDEDASTHTGAGLYQLVLESDSHIAAVELGAKVCEVGTNIGSTLSVQSSTTPGDDGATKQVVCGPIGEGNDSTGFYVEFTRVPGFPASFQVPNATPYP